MVHKMIFSRPFIHYHKGLSEKKDAACWPGMHWPESWYRKKKSNATGRKEHLPPSFLPISTMNCQKRITFFSLFFNYFCHAHLLSSFTSCCERKKWSFFSAWSYYGSTFINKAKKPELLSLYLNSATPSSWDTSESIDHYQQISKTCKPAQQRLWSFVQQRTKKWLSTTKYIPTTREDSRGSAVNDVSRLGNR
jgi:hypothetical protein